MREAATRRNQTRKNVQEDISTACAAWMLAARTGQARYRDMSRAEARQLGPDAWGRVEFTNYNGPGNTLQRCLVLTRGDSGDRRHLHRRPALRRQGWRSTLATVHTPGARRDWFASQSDGVYTSADGSTAKRRMLVKFMNSPGVTIDAEHIQPATMHAPKADGTRHREFFTTYSKRILSAGRTAVSALAVLPLRTGDVVLVSCREMPDCASATNPWPSFATSRARGICRLHRSGRDPTYRPNRIGGDGRWANRVAKSRDSS